MRNFVDLDAVLRRVRPGAAAGWAIRGARRGRAPNGAAPGGERRVVPRRGPGARAASLVARPGGVPLPPPLDRLPPRARSPRRDVRWRGLRRRRALHHDRRVGAAAHGDARDEQRARDHRRVAPRGRRARSHLPTTCSAHSAPTALRGCTTARRSCRRAWSRASGPTTPSGSSPPSSTTPIALPGTGPIAVGALPFDPTAVGELVVPAASWVGRPTGAAGAPRSVATSAPHPSLPTRRRAFTW